MLATRCLEARQYRQKRKGVSDGRTNGHIHGQKHGRTYFKRCFFAPKHLKKAMKKPYESIGSKTSEQVWSRQTSDASFPHAPSSPPPLPPPTLSPSPPQTSICRSQKRAFSRTEKTGYRWTNGRTDGPTRWTDKPL